MTNTTLRIGLGAMLCVLLAGCNLPRGAALESEILRTSSGSGGAVVRDFAVEPVTRDQLPRLLSWPTPQVESLGWLSHQDGSPNRTIRAGDVLTITIWNTEENSLITRPGERATTMEAVTVSSTGEVFMPYIGNIQVAGMSPDRARAVIEERFVEVTPSAQVQLEIRESAGSTVSLVGGVTNPGSYPMPDQSFTVLSLIAQGGGVPNALNNPQIRLIRGDSIYGTSIDRLFENPGLDTTLRPGDKVIVEEDERFFLSLGAAGSEDLHRFPRDEVSALEALSIIGGVQDSRGNPQGILVLRTYPASSVRVDGTGPAHERVVFTMDLTTADGLFSAGEFPIRSGDLVYATESPVSAAQTIISILGNGTGLLQDVGLVN